MQQRRKNKCGRQNRITSVWKTESGYLTGVLDIGSF